jgi:hypothetical protein
MPHPGSEVTRDGWWSFHRSTSRLLGSLEEPRPGAILDLLRLLNWPLKLAFFVGRWIYVTFFVDEDQQQPPPG